MDEPALTAILILPDAPSTSAALAECLRAEDFRVHEPESDREAIRLAALRPDLILLADPPEADAANPLESRLRAIVPDCVLARVPVPPSGSAEGPGPEAPVVLAAVLKGMLGERRNAAEAAENRAAEEEIAALERDVFSVDRLEAEASTSLASPPFRPLRVGQPERFAEAAAEFGRILERGLEQKAFRVEHDLTGGLRMLAERLARSSCGPRDVIEIHATTLKRKTFGVAAARARAYTEEGRMLVLELMGHLVAIYRRGPSP